MSAAEEQEKLALARAARGDREAFAVVVRTYGRQLAKLAGGYGVSPGDIEDVVQDAFVAAWRGLADFDQSRPFRAWLFHILFNKALDWRRRRRVRALFYGAAALDSADEVPLDQPSADDVTADRQALKRVNEALAALPEDLKRPLLLIAVAGLSRAEAADTLKITLKALDGRIDRARLRLNALLTGRENARG